MLYKVLYKTLYFLNYSDVGPCQIYMIQLFAKINNGILFCA